MNFRPRCGGNAAVVRNISSVMKWGWSGNFSDIGLRTSDFFYSIFFRFSDFVKIQSLNDSFYLSEGQVKACPAKKGICQEETLLKLLVQPV
jgi:hypothetical protein